MKLKVNAKELKDMFSRTPALGAPFVNMLKGTDSDRLMQDDKIALPILITGDLFIAHLQMRSRQPIRYCGYPEYVRILTPSGINNLAVVVGRCQRVLIFKIAAKYRKSCLEGCDALLCNLSLEASNHREVTLKIVRNGGTCRAYLNHLANYIQCEETYHD